VIVAKLVVNNVITMLYRLHSSSVRLW